MTPITFSNYAKSLLSDFRSWSSGVSHPRGKEPTIRQIDEARRMTQYNIAMAQQSVIRESLKGITDNTNG